ncbi:MAG: amidohydrolase family protein [Acidobacteriota bacterium]
MRVLRIFLLLLVGCLCCARAARPQAAPLVLSGGTVVDLTNWGRSAADLANAIVIVQNGRIVEVGPAGTVEIPKTARVIDCTGKFILPGLIDGFAGMASQDQANANLYMGVTTVVATADSHRGHIDFHANPSPHLYPVDSVGTTDDWSLLIGHDGWTSKLAVIGHPTELTPDNTLQEMVEQAKLGTKVLWIGPNVTAANAQWIITRAHQLGLVTYGEFVATPYQVGIEAGVDALLHMGRYELGVIPDELQTPLAQDPQGGAASSAYDYAEHLPPTDLHLRRYASFIASHHAALMPTFSMDYLRLPGHRNLWTEPAASILNPARMSDPPDRQTGELTYPLPQWSRHLPGFAQRYLEANLQKKADQSALRLWHINQAIFAAYPHYLAASGASVSGTMAGISMHTELEMLVRIGLTPREALAAATNNYSLQFNWQDIGQVAPGRRADILVVDGNPTVSVWNARKISTLILDGRVLDRAALLAKGQ